MCGLIGYVGQNKASDILLGALGRLEYRGYDSAGIATVQDNKIYLEKDKGKVKKVFSSLNSNSLPGTVGIGHVRWATHGKVTRENAHPHCDENQQISVIHNGIIENYTALKAFLSPKYKFLSETDSEVIPHLMRHYMDTGLSFEDSFFAATLDLKGSFAVLAVNALEPNKILAARRESPLVIGIGDRENFAGSDVLSFLPLTNKVIYLNDGDRAVLTANSIDIYDATHHPVSRESAFVDWKWHEDGKGYYDHFMLKEIEEQPRAIREAIIQDDHLLTRMAIEILRARQVVFVACGTSRHAALIGRYVFSKIGHCFSDVVMGSEFGYFSDSIDKNTLVIAISQSGETADVLDGVRLAKANGATVFSIVNVVGSTLARMSDRALYLNCGPEVGVAATKSFMAELCILYLLAFSMDDRREEGRNKLRKISDIVENDIHFHETYIANIASRLKDHTDFYYVARGINYAIAGEGALKLKEIAYVHAEGIPAGELKHGTLALIENKTPVMAICPTDYTYMDSISNIMEMKARGAYIMGVSDAHGPILDDCIKVTKVEEIFLPLVTILPLQLFAYYSAVVRGLDPDRPRNLAKSVTVK